MAKTDRIPGNVASAMRKLADQRAMMAADADVRKAREELMLQTHRLRQAEARLSEVEEPYRKDMGEIEQYIKVQALEVEASFEHAGIAVSYRKGYERVTWKTEILQELIEADPKLGKKLAPARQVAAVPPKVEVLE